MHTNAALKQIHLLVLILILMVLYEMIGRLHVIYNRNGLLEVSLAAAKAISHLDCR